MIEIDLKPQTRTIPSNTDRTSLLDPCQSEYKNYNKLLFQIAQCKVIDVPVVYTHRYRESSHHSLKKRAVYRLDIVLLQKNLLIAVIPCKHN